MVMSR